MSVQKNWLDLRKVVTLTDLGRHGPERNNDGVTHTCGALAVPPSASNQPTYGNMWVDHMKISGDLTQAIELAYSNMNFDFAKPRALWGDFLGMWPHFFRSEVENGIRKNHHKSSMSSFLDLFCESDLTQVMEELRQTPPMQRLVENQLGEIVANNRQRRLDSASETYTPDVSDIWFQRALTERAYSFLSQKLVAYFHAEIHECEHFNEKLCLTCGNKYLPQFSVNIAGLAPPLFCNSCSKVIAGDAHAYLAEPKNVTHLSLKKIKELFASGLSNYVDKYGYIPTGNTKHELRKAYLDGDTPEVLKEKFFVISAVAPKVSAIKVFGSYAHYLNEAGLLEGTRSGHGGYRSVASDGHLCLSLGERTICEFFSRNGLRHEKEPHYPEHNLLNPGKRLRADFLVGTSWIEFGGRMSNIQYKERMNDKRRIANEHGMNWMLIEPKDLGDLEAIFAHNINPRAMPLSGRS